MARTLAVQTARGAAETLAGADADPVELRRNVASKGGVTEAAFKVLDEAGTRGTFREAVEAAIRRAKELGRS